VTNQLVKSEIRSCQSGKVASLSGKEVWSIDAMILISDKEI
jgi:hypothetical protein